MATLCRPAIAVPEHVITMQQTLDLARETHAGHPQRDPSCGSSRTPECRPGTSCSPSRRP